MASAGQQQPAWRAPEVKPDQTDLPSLTIYNSLTRTKTPFVPIQGKKIGWYACGPTVYDDAHLGHARNYVSQDIIRRLLQDYFGFDVNFVMNITDVDDKIILAARQQHLLDEWKGEHTEVDEDVRTTAANAFAAYIEKNLPLLGSSDPAAFQKSVEDAYGHVLAGESLTREGPPGDKEAKVKMYLDIARSAAHVLNSTDNTNLEDFVSRASGVLRPFLDKQRSSKIDGSNHTIFTPLIKKYEQRFFEDMERLNVRYPDKLTRVTEYTSQIAKFVEQIQDNGYAYEHEGSVYYDTTAWEGSGGVYARLEPWNRNDKELQADGEGSLSVQKTSFKKSGADFALWKASKAGEPHWDSRWGKGRPGWHIECSAMASDILGKQFDIHSGGIDLAFPHHDNELAQSEAYWHKCGAESQQWVNYFLHMGHLSISGSKMSKSLKNFTTIKEALDRGDFTSRSLRIIYLLGAWRDGLEITPDLRKASMSWEDKVDNFFIKVRDVQTHPTHASGASGDVPSSDLDKMLDESKSRLHNALLDSFDTPLAMRILSDLISAYNSTSSVSDQTATSIGQWITHIVVTFGLDAEYKPGQMGWSGVDIPEKAKPFIYPLSELRDKVREQAIAGGVDIASLGRLDEKDNFYTADQPYARAYADFERKIVELNGKDAPSKEYLAACDYLRDTVLWELNIYLEDREKRHALVRPLSNSLREERRDREAKAEAKAKAKEDAQKKAAAAEQERLEKGKLSHLEMFKTNEYSEWDADGLPIKEADGKEVAKSKSKKNKKLWEQQKKLHEAYLASRT
jgi:cysteinyl-tRNA synthetase